VSTIIHDVTVIGGGIVGLATAWQILQQHQGIRVAVIEKEKAIGLHQTNRNSGVIHSGIYYKPGSAKATNCVRGYTMLLEFAKAHDIPFDLCGKVIVATHEDQFVVMEDIYQRGLKNGLGGIRIIDQQEVQSIEPHCAAIKGIWVPQAGIIDYRVVAEKLASLITAKGGKIITDFEVSHIQHKPGSIHIANGSKALETKLAIGCAGLYADKLATLAGMKVPHQIVPFRGEFYSLTKPATRLVKGLIYPVPDVNFPFLGVHLTKRLDGGIEAGPNAVLAFRREGYDRLDFNARELLEILGYRGFQHLAVRHWRKGMIEMQGSFSKSAFLSRIRELVPEIGEKDIVRGRSGVRAQALDRNGNLVDDYVILEQEHMLHVCNAPSPAATSCLSIGNYIASKVEARIAIL
jgi:L-2-hydroxyglutarate oxidase